MRTMMRMKSTPSSFSWRCSPRVSSHSAGQWPGVSTNQRWVLFCVDQSEASIVLCQPIRDEFFLFQPIRGSTHLVVEKEAYAHHSYGLTLVCVHWTPTLNEKFYKSEMNYFSRMHLLHSDEPHCFEDQTSWEWKDHTDQHPELQPWDPSSGEPWPAEWSLLTYQHHPSLTNIRLITFQCDARLQT